MENWEFYVSPQGNDQWSGRLSSPSADGNDGPFRTLEKARDVIRALNSRGKLYKEVKVFIRGGEYPVKKPVDFDERDSFPTTYQAYPGEQPVFNGGIRLTGFTEETLANGCTAWVKELPEVGKSAF